jgi:hypothetical protein
MTHGPNLLPLGETGPLHILNQSWALNGTATALQSESPMTGSSDLAESYVMDDPFGGRS